MGIINKIKEKFIHREIKCIQEIKPIIRDIHHADLLKGKTALITGGTGGIGMAIAEAAIKCGCFVILCGTDERKIKDKCAILGEKARGCFLNLNHITSMPSVIKKAISLSENKKIDILINSAGVHGEWNYNDITEDEFDKIMDVNVKGTYFFTNYVSQYMISNKIAGHILNISSSSALRHAWTPYQISKWALNGMTKGFADVLLPYGIVVNGLAPGPVATQMLGVSKENIYYREQPSHRYLTPEEVANFAIFLISSMGDMMVGETYYMTGGSGNLFYHK